MSKTSTNALLLGVGVAAVAAFFMPFLDLGGIASASGWEIMVADPTPWFTRVIMGLVPLSGLALIAASATGAKQARWAGVGFGLAVFGYPGYTVVKLFAATTGLGLWLTLAAAAVALFAGLASRGR